MKYSVAKNKIRLIIIVVMIISITSCDLDDLGYEQYQTGIREYDKQILHLLRVLDENSFGVEYRFVVVQEIAKILKIAELPLRKLMFLSSYVESNPRDPYNSYHLFTVAEGYREMGSLPVAGHYYERILRNYRDAVVQGKSIHLAALQELLKYETDPIRKVSLYKELIERFRDSIDIGRSYFFLAMAYEAIGEWEQAIQAYKLYLQYPKIEIKGFPNSYQKVLQKVNFHYSDKSWIADDVNSLVTQIKRAILRRDSRALRRLRAKSGFFTMSWERQIADEGAIEVFDISSFRLSRVRFDRDLDSDSNEREAFLRTTGWSYRVETWYLYFRRVNFKADPSIDGKWEWAGIFFGEKL